MQAEARGPVPPVLKDSKTCSETTHVGSLAVGCFGTAVWAEGGGGLSVFLTDYQRQPGVQGQIHRP